MTVFFSLQASPGIELPARTASESPKKKHCYAVLHDEALRLKLYMYIYIYINVYVYIHRHL